LGNHIHYTLDALGNRKATDVKDPSGLLKRTQSNVYNTLNQLSQRVGADKGIDTQIIFYDEYDANGNLIKIRDTKGNVTEYGYDAFDRISTVLDALNGITKYTYTSMGKLETVTDPRGNATTYQYDGLGNLTQLDSPDTSVSNYTGYDDAGNLVTRVDAKGQGTAYVYDALNRLTQVTYADTSTVVYSYDLGINSTGRLSSITDSAGVIAYQYDLRGRVTNKTQTIGSLNLGVGYDYNDQSQLEKVTYPSGKVIGYGYLNGKVNQLTVDGVIVLDNVSYDPFGPITGWDLGVGASPKRISRDYDLDGQLQTYSLGNNTQQISYTSTGNISLIQQIGNPANDQSYDYDGLYRLSDYTGPKGASIETHIYAYDANGNRTAQVIDGIGYGYGVDVASNRLQSVAGPTAKNYVYDVLGNIASDGLHIYEYDTTNRLVGVDASVRYTLNSLGQRITKNVPAVDLASLSGDANGDSSINNQDYNLILNHILGLQSTTNGDCNQDGIINVGDLVCVNIKINGTQFHGTIHFAYNEQGQLIGEYDVAGNVIQETIYIGNIPVAVLKDGNVYYIHTDHLNTPRAITDALNTVYWQWQSDPFGTTEANEDVDGDGVEFIYNLRFPGQYYDNETGLQYNYFRYYDPSTGRYITSDPIGLRGGLNTYGYVGGNPNRFIDPYGLAGALPVAGGGIIVFCSRFPAACLGGAVAICRFFGGCELPDDPYRNESGEDGEQCPTEGGNNNPYDGPVDIPVIVVDGNGNAIPVGEGESISSSPDGTWQQVRDPAGNPTGTRVDGGHPNTHDDPRAQDPHAHVPGITNSDGTPWLPLQ